MIQPGSDESAGLLFQETFRVPFLGKSSQSFIAVGAINRQGSLAHPGVLQITTNASEMGKDLESKA